MAKREISSTLKNLKFMQRTVQKVEKPKEVEEETKPDGNFSPPSNVRRKCMVIMEGDPHPVTVGGRMSFQNYNPYIDKLKEETANGYEAQASTSSVFQSGTKNERESISDRTGIETGNDVVGELKRKQLGESSQTSHPKKLQKNSQGNKIPKPDYRNYHKQSKREKLDFNVLAQQKSKNKRKGR